MQSKQASLSREKSAHKEQMLTAIGRWLRQEYNAVEPLPDRLADLVKEIEQSTSERHSERR